jgi:hypothetical protein
LDEESIDFLFLDKWWRILLENVGYPRSAIYPEGIENIGYDGDTIWFSPFFMGKPSINGPSIPWLC